MTGQTWSCQSRDFNPRSPRGERRCAHKQFINRQSISIHAPREGSDSFLGVAFNKILEFQSTLPARGATYARARLMWIFGFQSTLPARGATADAAYMLHDQDISIHAPREGSDVLTVVILPKISNFNPRSPRGERRLDCKHGFATAGFQSTLPARGATVPRRVSPDTRVYFNPRSPRGERR